MPMSSETRLSQVSTYLELGVGSHHRQTSLDDISPFPTLQALHSLRKLLHLSLHLQQTVIIKNQPFVGVVLLEIQSFRSHTQAE